MVNAIEDSQIRISLPTNFHFDHCLKFLDRNANECLHRVENGSWLKLIKLEGVPVIIRVSAQKDYLLVESLTAKLNVVQKTALTSFLVEVFDLERDLSPFYQKMQKDPVMGGLCEQYLGLRLLGIPDLFEALCWCIIGQQINLNFAYKLKQRLVQAVGEKLHFQGTDYYAFPSAKVISDMSVKDFSNWQYSASKASYLIGVAQEIQKGSITKGELLVTPPEKVAPELMKLKGIGMWSAQYVMMKCLRVTTAFPAQDVGLQNAIKDVTDSPHKPSISQMEEFNNSWHPWQSYATFYLWHSLIA